MEPGESYRLNAETLGITQALDILVVISACLAILGPNSLTLACISGRLASLQPLDGASVSAKPAWTAA